MYVLVNTETITIDLVSHCIRLCTDHFTVSTLYRVAHDVGIMAMLKGDRVYNTLADAIADSEIKFPKCKIDRVLHWRIYTARDTDDWASVYSKMCLAPIKKGSEEPT